jgi:hypothetical protein
MSKPPCVKCQKYAQHTYISGMLSIIYAAEIIHNKIYGQMKSINFKAKKGKIRNKYFMAN